MALSELSHIYLMKSCDPTLLAQIFLLSTILSATVTYQRDHLSTVRPLENGFDICAIGIGKSEPEYIQVVLWVF
jgi:hypothetical protein